MSLRTQQAKFTEAVGKLILFAYENSYELTHGDAWAKKGEGRPHSTNSKHYIRLAIDFNLFKDGKYLTRTEDHEPLGLFWEKLGGIWGGRFKDGNHYEWDT